MLATAIAAAEAHHEFAANDNSPEHAQALRIEIVAHLELLYVHFLDLMAGPTAGESEASRVILGMVGGLR
jgi:hypothetical protein